MSSIDELIIELEEIENLGIKTVAIFPKINEKKKHVLKLRRNPPLSVEGRQLEDRPSIENVEEKTP